MVGLFKFEEFVRSSNIRFDSGEPSRIAHLEPTAKSIDLLKILTGKSHRHSTNLLYKNLNLLKINEIHLIKIYSVLYKYSMGSLPKIFNELFNPNRTERMETRTNSIFSMTKYKTNQGKFLLNNYGTRLWNNLPNKIKTSPSYKVFTKRIKSHLLSKYDKLH